MINPNSRHSTSYCGIIRHTRAGTSVSQIAKQKLYHLAFTARICRIEVVAPRTTSIEAMKAVTRAWIQPSKIHLAKVRGRTSTVYFIHVVTFSVTPTQLVGTRCARCPSKNILPALAFAIGVCTCEMIAAGYATIQKMSSRILLRKTGATMQARATFSIGQTFIAGLRGRAAVAPMSAARRTEVCRRPLIILFLNPSGNSFLQAAFNSGILYKGAN